MSAEQALHVGELAGRADHDDVVDVAVVEGAARREDDAIITSNEAQPKDRGSGAPNDPDRDRLTVALDIEDPPGAVGICIESR